MNPFLFAFRQGASLIPGAAIGLERLWRQRTTGMRANAPVAVGAAMFVTMGGLISSGDGSQGRVAAYVVSGVGFLGGGVILKGGFNIRGLNTAATLWCTAAVGTLVALGQIGAAIGTAALPASNLLLRPISQGVSKARGKGLNADD